MNDVRKGLKNENVQTHIENNRFLKAVGIVLSRLGGVLGQSRAVLDPSWGHLGAVLGCPRHEDELRKQQDGRGCESLNFYLGFHMVLSKNRPAEGRKPACSDM